MRGLRIVIATAVIGAVITGLKYRDTEHPMLSRPQPAATLTAVDHELDALPLATRWLNSPPLTASALRGKVVLVQFWTYTCINWRRTEPYIRAWAARYKDQGLVVIGVHAPEFDFEKDSDNVSRSVQAMDIRYPIAVDNDHAIWGAFGNQYWPALYFIDANGRLRHHVYGEGEYQFSERVIQQLLAEAGHGKESGELVRVAGTGPEAEADWGGLRSQENYLGAERTEGFASPGPLTPNRLEVFAAPGRLRLNQWALIGAWTVGSGSTALARPNGRMLYRFHARDLHLVMGPAIAGHAVRFRVLMDGASPGDSHGGDVNAEGYGTLDEQRMYQLIRQSDPVEDRLFEIEFLDPGAELFSITFG